MKRENIFLRILATVLIINLFAVVIYLKKSGENAIADSISNFSGSKVTLPDSIPEPEGGRLATMVIWYDSASCATCLMNRISEWLDLLEQTDMQKGFQPVFIFTPREADREKYEKAKARAELPYTVISDYDGFFPQDNPGIPQAHEFHTFLLDGTGHVVMTGNPMGNRMLWGLYRTYITALLENNGMVPEGIDGKVADYMEKARSIHGLVFDRTEQELGDLAQENEYICVFTAENLSKKPAEITALLPDCDCMTVTASQEKLQPGQKTVVRVSFQTDAPGAFTKYLFVSWKEEGLEEEGSQELSISGNVI